MACKLVTILSFFCLVTLIATMQYSFGAAAAHPLGVIQSVELGVSADSLDANQFSSDGKYLLLVKDNTVFLSVLNEKTMVSLLSDQVNGISSAQFSPDCKYILTTSVDPRQIGTRSEMGEENFNSIISLWDIQTGRLVHTFIINGKACYLAEFSPDGRYIVTAAMDDCVYLWDIWNLSLAPRKLCHANSVFCIKISPNGRYIAISSRCGVVRLLDMQTIPLVIKFVPCSYGKPLIIFSSDNRYIGLRSKDNFLSLWDIPTLAFVRKIPIVSGLGSCKGMPAEFSPDGRYVVSTPGNRVACVWDTSNWSFVRFLAGHQGSVRSAEFSHDGRYVVTASGDHSACIWNAQTGAPMHVLGGHESNVNQARFSPDGKYIVTLTCRGKVRLWWDTRVQAQTKQASIILAFGAQNPRNVSSPVQLIGDSSLLSFIASFGLENSFAPVDMQPVFPMPLHAHVPVDGSNRINFANEDDQD